MKKIIKSMLSLIVALVGLVGGIVWAIGTGWDYEPIILLIVSGLEILAYFLVPSEVVETKEVVTDNRTVINNIVNVGKYPNPQQHFPEERSKQSIRILFIDDNYADFKMVSILKKSGWINTKSVKDILALDDPKVIEANIIFVDINGVGTTLFQDQGLGLASALKKRYSDKCVVIYSADTQGDRFHKALREVDDCLHKDAEPYQFINLIENYSKNKA